MVRGGLKRVNESILFTVRRQILGGGVGPGQVRNSALIPGITRFTVTFSNTLPPQSPQLAVIKGFGSVQLASPIHATAWLCSHYPHRITLLAAPTAQGQLSRPPAPPLRSDAPHMKHHNAPRSMPTRSLPTSQGRKKTYARLSW